MFDIFLFVGLPYLALFVFAFGSIFRFVTNQFSYSSLSSQFLENRTLLWGSVPWHAGLLIIIGGHFFAFIMPRYWQSLTSHETFLLAVEGIGIMGSLLCIAGLVILLLRRVGMAKVRAVTSKMDVVIVCLLLFQVIIGLCVALFNRWGAVWSTGTTTPYLWSLLTLKPDISYVTELTFLMRCHLVGASLLFLLVPFSRLVHLFVPPIGYLFRPPQKVLWTNQRRNDL